MYYIYKLYNFRNTKITEMNELKHKLKELEDKAEHNLLIEQQNFVEIHRYLVYTLSV